MKKSGIILIEKKVFLLIKNLFFYEKKKNEITITFPRSAKLKKSIGKQVFSKHFPIIKTGSIGKINKDFDFQFEEFSILDSLHTQKGSIRKNP